METWSPYDTWQHFRPYLLQATKDYWWKNYEMPPQLRIKTLKEIYPNNMKKEHNTSRKLKASYFLLVSPDYETKSGFQVSVTSELSELNGKALWIIIVNYPLSPLTFQRNASFPGKVSKRWESSSSLFYFSIILLCLFHYYYRWEVWLWFWNVLCLFLL